jgi:hypothetical protein
LSDVFLPPKVLLIFWPHIRHEVVWIHENVNESVNGAYNYMLATWKEINLNSLFILQFHDTHFAFVLHRFGALITYNIPYQNWWIHKLENLENRSTFSLFFTWSDSLLSPQIPTLYCPYLTYSLTYLLTYLLHGAEYYLKSWLSLSF